MTIIYQDIDICHKYCQYFSNDWKHLNIYVSVVPNLYNFVQNFKFSLLFYATLFYWQFVSKPKYSNILSFEEMSSKVHHMITHLLSLPSIMVSITPTSWTVPYYSYCRMTFLDVEFMQCFAKISRSRSAKLIETYHRSLVGIFAALVLQSIDPANVCFFV